MTTTITSQDRVKILHEWNKNQVALIHEPGVDLTIIARETYPAIISAVLDRARIDSLRSVVSQHNAAEQVEQVLVSLGLSGDRALVDDMRQIVEKFLDQFAIKQANLRIELLDSQSCPKFHCDARKIRLITTYYGPTTQYRYADPNAEPVSMDLCAIAFLKGTTHPSHQGEHVLHRSPPVANGQRRLCLVLDF